MLGSAGISTPAAVWLTKRRDDATENRFARANARSSSANNSDRRHAHPSTCSGKMCRSRDCVRTTGRQCRRSARNVTGKGARTRIGVMRRHRRRFARISCNSGTHNADGECAERVVVRLPTIVYIIGALSGITLCVDVCVLRSMKWSGTRRAKG